MMLLWLVFIPCSSSSDLGGNLGQGQCKRCPRNCQLLASIHQPRTCTALAALPSSESSSWLALYLILSRPAQHSATHHLGSTQAKASTPPPVTTQNTACPRRDAWAPLDHSVAGLGGYRQGRRHCNGGSHQGAVIRSPVLPFRGLGGRV